MRVFISHQHTDSAAASAVAARLKTFHQIDFYLDVIDPSVRHGDDLTDHIRAQLSMCTQLLAVVSDATRLSWWVPWEIGVASEKDYPLATYTNSATALPEYLQKWPYLRNMADVDQYATVSKSAANAFVRKKGYLTEETARLQSTKEFFRTLRGALRQ